MNAKPSPPINLTTTAHKLVPAPVHLGDTLLNCETCGAVFNQPTAGNFGWAVTPGVGAACEPNQREYRALSTKQPWAGMIARGEKSLEIRSQNFKYRGELLIIAGQKADHLRWLHPAWPAHQAARDPLGVAICLVDLYDCRPMRREDEPLAGCPYEPGLWALCLRNPRPVKPVPVKGMLGLLKVSLTLELAE